MKKLIVFAALLFLIVVSSSSVNQGYCISTSLDDLDAIPPGWKTYSIPPCAVKPGSILQYDSSKYYFTTGNASTIAHSVDGSIYNNFTFIAPIFLPDGAIIKKFGAVCIDRTDAPLAKVSIYIGRLEHRTGDLGNIALVDTLFLPASDDKIVLVDHSIENPLVENHLYSYYLYVKFEKVGPNPDFEFNGAAIVYE